MNRLAYLLLLATVCAACAQDDSVPQPPLADAEALQIVNHCVRTSGGRGVIDAVKDFAASGTITYYSGGNPEGGTVVIRGVGDNSFRADASLPMGIRTWAVVSGKGEVRETDGTKRDIPEENSLNLGAITFPVLKLAAGLRDTHAVFDFKGTVDVHGRKAYDIQLHREIASQAAREIFKRLTTQKFLIDATTFEILSMRDSFHPNGRPFQNIPHEIEFSDYRMVSGILLPFIVTETVNRQRAWVIHLDDVRFNSGILNKELRITDASLSQHR